MCIYFWEDSSVLLLAIQCEEMLYYIQMRVSLFCEYLLPTSYTCVWHCAFQASNTQNSISYQLTGTQEVKSKLSSIRWKSNFLKRVLPVLLFMGHLQGQSSLRHLRGNMEGVNSCGRTIDLFSLVREHKKSCSQVTQPISMACSALVAMVTCFIPCSGSQASGSGWEWTEDRKHFCPPCFLPAQHWEVLRTWRCQFKSAPDICLHQFSALTCLGKILCSQPNGEKKKTVAEVVSSHISL